MADANQTPEESPHFETDEVMASRAREQGLGVGARELEAQRDPGGVNTADEEDDTVERSTAVQGLPDEEAYVGGSGS